jgi:NADH dehydrogenase [ubiquinone] 1 alpha subcomplex assembly factor 7
MTGGNSDERKTPLAIKLKRRIRRDGPISVAAYMQACMLDSEHGYYRRQPAIGAEADFITAPEISQVFGELIGLWCAVVWQRMGAPSRLNLVELGPGRGTLMRDALRAMRVVPGLHAALEIHLVDKNETLRAIQQATLEESGVALNFHAEASRALMMPSKMAPEPTILIANEFLDALPVYQFEYVSGKWRDRDVGLGGGGDRLSFVADMTSSVTPPFLPEHAAPEEGSVFETSTQYGVFAGELFRTRAELAPFAALLIDYGHMKTALGDTLQGVAGQAHVSPFHAPGETDLSVQVDFERFTAECRSAGLDIDGPVPQGEFLGRLGIMERASRLMAANPDKALAIETGVARLMAPGGMGSHFKAIGLSTGLAPLPGFA